MSFCQKLNVVFCQKVSATWTLPNVPPLLLMVWCHCVLTQLEKREQKQWQEIKLNSQRWDPNHIVKYIEYSSKDDQESIKHSAKVTNAFGHTATPHYPLLAIVLETDNWLINESPLVTVHFLRLTQTWWPRAHLSLCGESPSESKECPNCSGGRWGSE